MAKRVKKSFESKMAKLIKEIEYRQEQLAELITENEKARHRPAEDRRRRRRKKKKKDRKGGGGSKRPKKRRRKT